MPSSSRGEERQTGNVRVRVRASQAVTARAFQCSVPNGQPCAETNKQPCPESADWAACFFACSGWFGTASPHHTLSPPLHLHLLLRSTSLPTPRVASNLPGSQSPGVPTATAYTRPVRSLQARPDQTRVVLFWKPWKP